MTVRAWVRMATAQEITDGVAEDCAVSPKGLADANFPVPPAKATGAEVTTGTNDAKFATPKALADAGVTPIKTKASAAEVTTGTDDDKFATPKAIKDAGIVAVTLPVKATGAEVTTGTDDDKFATPKAIKDAGIVAVTVPVKATGAELTTGTDDAKFLTAKAAADAGINIPGRAASHVDAAGTGPAAHPQGMTIASAKVLQKLGTETNTAVLCGPTYTNRGFGFGTDKDRPAVISGGAVVAEWDPGSMILNGSITPDANRDLGTSAAFWRRLYAGSILGKVGNQSSDTDFSTDGDSAQLTYWRMTTGSSTDKTYTLPAASAGLAGKFYRFIKVDSGTKAVIVDAGAGKLIYSTGIAAGQQTMRSTTQWGMLTIFCTGAEWIVCSSTGTWT